MKQTILMMGVVGALLGSPALAQTPQAPSPQPSAQAAAAAAQAAKDCANAACRKALPAVVIRIDEARFRTIPVPQSPYVLDANALLIFPGETVAIQFAVEGDKIVGAKLLERLAPALAAPLLIEQKVAANPDDAALRKIPDGLPKAQLAAFPANVMLLSYGQSSGKPDTMLYMQHNLARNVKVDAIMALFGPEGYVQRSTSTCVLMPNVLGAEHWPQPLGPMILTKPRLLPDGADMSCS